MARKEKAKSKKILQIIEVLLSLVIVLSLIGKVQTGWMNICGYRVFYVMSGSMEPLIHKGQFVVGRVVREEEKIEIGQVYAYQKNTLIGSEWIIHRIIEFDAITDTYILKGDANSFADSDEIHREKIAFTIQN